MWLMVWHTLGAHYSSYAVTVCSPETYEDARGLSGWKIRLPFSLFKTANPKLQLCVRLSSQPSMCINTDLHHNMRCGCRWETEAQGGKVIVPKITSCEARVWPSPRLLLGPRLEGALVTLGLASSCLRPPPHRPLGAASVRGNGAEQDVALDLSPALPLPNSQFLPG